MSEEYTLVRDIVYDHNERMLNIKKYLPFFRLMDTSFQQYREGSFANLDMGYILMAVLRFFIEENNFRDKMVNYEEYSEFIHNILIRDFEIDFSMENGRQMEKELIGLIFDKLSNEGKPFSYEYFDPASKKRKTVRVKIIDNRIIEGEVVYYITSDGIEFYLDTKEIKDESNITVAQVLLEKMIATRNFRGGTEVVIRINNEVSKLISRKNEILNILSYNVFEGIKAYEDFLKTGTRWFEQEQKLFLKNKELIHKCLKAGEEDNRYFEAMGDIYHLETELNRAMKKHSELLNACTTLQKTTDEIIYNAKINRLRSTFDFRRVLSEIIDSDNVSSLELFAKPLMKLKTDKNFSLPLIDNLLTFRQDNVEEKENVSDNIYNEDFKYPDEVEEERICDNYSLLIKVLCMLIKERKVFNIVDYNRVLEEKCGKIIFSNSDYYSFIVHLCQKTQYSFKEIRENPSTFLEEIINKCINEGLLNGEDMEISFDIEFDDNDDIITINNNQINNIHIYRR